ncbi:MAG: adenylate/guanylate cyclase domain-containing protein [Spirochaetia bacterium]|nr:adenylate/guanylate cyclase domain-containing protein [Spirochaetia bacterium]
MDEKQLPKGILDKINEQIELFNQKNNIDIIDSIPDTNNIPKEGNKWLKINDVICVYTDMIGSTRLSAEQKYDSSTASAYELFTGTIIKIFHFYDASYVEVQGDGVFALFNKNEIYRSLVSAVTVKTFVEKSFIPLYKQRSKLDLGVHIGIDKKTVLVKKIGLRQKNNRSDRRNEVWAGKPVNMAAKLASLTEKGQLMVSDRYYKELKSDYALKSCGCENGTYTGEKKIYGNHYH